MCEEAPSQEFELTYASGHSDSNYVSLDDSPHTAEVLKALVDQKFVKKCSGLVEAMTYLRGERPVVSKGALISKMKDGVLKHRLILDCRISGANAATTKWERIVLPKGWDIVRDAMRLKQHAVQEGRDPSLTYFVCDVSDAFYKVPLLEAEQKYFVLCYDGDYYVWLRVGQGSLNGPTLFGRLAAMSSLRLHR